MATSSSPHPTSASPLQRLGVRLLYIVPVIVLSGFLLAGSAPTHLAAAPQAVTQQLELKPTDRHRKIARLVAEVMGRSHYRQTTVDDQLSSQVFDRYLESLDGNRSYLLASDVQELERYRYQLADDIRTGALEPAFVIF